MQRQTDGEASLTLVLLIHGLFSLSNHLHRPNVAGPAAALRSLRPPQSESHLNILSMAVSSGCFSFLPEGRLVPATQFICGRVRLHEWSGDAKPAESPVRSEGNMQGHDRLPFAVTTTHVGHDRTAKTAASARRRG